MHTAEGLWALGILLSQYSSFLLPMPANDGVDASMARGTPESMQKPRYDVMRGVMYGWKQVRHATPNRSTSTFQLHVVMSRLAF